MSVWNRVLGDVRPGDTVMSILDRNKGVGPGFEMLRIILATSVLFAHLIWLTKDHGSKGAIILEGIGKAVNIATIHKFFYPMMYEAGYFYHAVRICIVPSFFALSGFLVTGSALRLRSVRTFLAFRILRIIPALSVEITLSALVLGPLLTTLTIRQYFSNVLLYRYFFNIIGEVQFLLPGLYVNNPIRSVNANLWTIPAELICYIAMSAVMLSGLLYNRLALTLAFIVVTTMLTIAANFFGYGSGDISWPVNSLALFFLAGIIFYHWRDKCKLRFDIFTAAVPLSLLCISSPALVYLAPLPIAYCTVFLGMYRFFTPRLIGSGDYSYGIYLYGAPLTQALICVFPFFIGRPALLALPTLGLVLSFAVFSWHFIEKPALKLKGLLPRQWFPPAKHLIPPSTGQVAQ